jgi:hypothetical protein
MLCHLFKNENVVSCRCILLASISSRARTQIRKSNDRSTEKTTLPSSPAHAGSACIAWSPATARTVEASQPNLARRFPTRDATEAGVGSAVTDKPDGIVEFTDLRCRAPPSIGQGGPEIYHPDPVTCVVCIFLKRKLGVHCHPGFETDTIWKLSLKIRLCSLYKVQTPLRQAQQPDTPAHRAGLRHRQKYE